jgi:DNA recombination protein RmuC
MNWIQIIIALFIGIIIGYVISIILKKRSEKTTTEIADELYRVSETQRKQDLEDIIENIKESFGNLSLEALKKSTDEFIKLGKTELEGKKGLIDQQLQNMTSELEKVAKLMKDLEKDRVEKFGELASQLKITSEQTETLRETTKTISEALASTKIRGQWGERMAEDVLQIAGFMEGINYLKQKAIGEIGTRPDFTFLLPRNLKLNMDVKFPLDNYMKFLETDSNLEKEKFRKNFLRDVKTKIKEVTTREYINPEQNTVDCVLLFIPNEQIYEFIHEQDSTILDEGIKNRVLICSPITLFAVLAVIRQAVDNFALEQTSREILSLLGVFKKQWDKFIEKMKLLGRRIEEAQKEYQSLTTTRRRQLEKPLKDIESLRTQREIPIALSGDKEELPPSSKKSKR